MTTKKKLDLPGKQPADWLTKMCFAQSDFVRDFITYHMPPDLVQAACWDTLQKENVELINHHRNHRMDVLYSLQTSLDIPLLAQIEQQTSLDKAYAHRNQCYQHDARYDYY